MTKVKPTTKEQLVYYLIQNISLGTYDRRFLTNLQSIQVRDKKPATSNQSDLLDKITLRYAKQLRRQEIDAEDMVKLPWGVEPIDSMPEFTDAFCEIKDNTIEVRSPYKKEFITDIKDSKIAVSWNREDRIWSVPLSEYSLKHVIDCLDDHYTVIRYCPKTLDIIERFAEYETATCWNPTYKRVNGNYMIAGINRSLNDALGDINMDVEPSTLAKLTSVGVEIDPDVLTAAAEEMWSTDEAIRLVEFATTTKTIMDFTEIPTLVKFLREVQCDYVLIQEAIRSSTTHIDQLKDLLTAKNIAFDVVTKQMDFDKISSKYSLPMIVNSALWGLNQSASQLGGCKTVFLANNKPVKIK